MSRIRIIFNKFFSGFIFIVLVTFSSNVIAADGEALFKANCASCHKPDKDFSGPALKGWKDKGAQSRLGI
jgi:cytochrome c551/c552